LRLGLALLGLASAGCQVLPDRGLAGPASEVIVAGFNFPPRLRRGDSPTLVLGTSFVGGHLGTHGYYYHPWEKNGIAYTRCGGHLDIMHVRIAADWTAYLAARSYRLLLRGDRTFSFKLLADRSRHHVQLSYPDDWPTRPPQQRQQIAREVALVLGPYLAFNLVTWHEILTWYGFRSAGVVPESHSAFSWEDSYSNLLGTIVASRALRDAEHRYNQAVTLALAEELNCLGVQPAAVCRQASRSVRGRWYAGVIDLSLTIRKRGLDIGRDNGLVTPILVPDVPGCAGAEPAAYPAPTLAALDSWGFSALLEIEPHEWEKDRILRIVYPDSHGTRIRPEAHFAPIMHHIRREAADRYGLESAVPYHPVEP